MKEKSASIARVVLMEKGGQSNPLCVLDLCGAVHLVFPKNIQPYSNIKTKCRGMLFYELKSRILPMELHQELYLCVS